MSTPSKHAFSNAAFVALKDIQLQTALDRGMTRAVNGRVAAMAETSDAPALRQQARRARLDALARLPELLEQFEAAVIANGGHVLWAEDAAEANALLVDLCKRENVTRITKGKSMVSEEAGVNHALEQAGIDVVESDLGEYILQLAGEPPSHIVFPVVHKTRQQVATVLQRTLNMPATDDPEKMTRFVRGVMREKFLAAELGISGANFAVAETGAIVTCENEGNNRLSTTMPRIHLAIVGIEKILATMEDLGTLMQLLPRSATGQRITVYNNIMTGPRQPGEKDGPEAFYVLLLDNGRTRILASEYAESLACIRCGACMNICPVYQNVGGHAYGAVYPGPIGSIVTPLLNGLSTAPELPQASSLCGACQAACPVDIAIPAMLLKLRRDLNDTKQTGALWRIAMRLWRTGMRSKALYDIGTFAGRIATRLLAGKSGVLRRLPPPLSGWTDSRDFPALSRERFRDRYAGRQAQRSKTS
jgi:L-lactate dehydrogenase complex protein LldF